MTGGSSYPPGKRMLCKETSVQEVPVPQHPSQQPRCCLAEGHCHRPSRGRACSDRKGHSRSPATADDAADAVNLGLCVQSRPGHVAMALWQMRGRPACHLPVLWPPVVQPAGPAGETEEGVEGALQAVQRLLCRQQGQRQGTPPPQHPTAHKTAVDLAQRTLITERSGTHEIHLFTA